MDIIAITGKGNKTINVHIRFIFIILAVIIFIVISVLFFYSITNYAKTEVDRNKLTQLRNENEVVKKEIKTIEKEISGLMVIIDSLELLDKKLRIYAPLTPINEELRNMGVGGYTPAYREELSPDIKTGLTDLTEMLDNLLARAKLQRESFNELAEHLDEKKFLRDHTPSIMPVQGWLIRGFGYHIDPFTGKVKMHEGLDIAAPVGTPIVAPADGTIRFAGNKGDLGLTVEIDHGYGFITLYAHCQRIRVTSGMRIKRGDVVAYLGTTGRSTGPHLHYEIRLSNEPLNPINYILSTAAIVD